MASHPQNGLLNVVESNHRVKASIKPDLEQVLWAVLFSFRVLIFSRILLDNYSKRIIEHLVVPVRQSNIGHLASASSCEDDEIKNLLGVEFAD